MNWWQISWWQSKKRDVDLERELRSDLELEEEEQREGGISEEEARYAALLAFGNPTLIREQTRAIWSWNWLESL
ncbi:MAG: permease prefix domain 1-containing protein, partial [Terriglobales bacterium]